MWGGVLWSAHAEVINLWVSPLNTWLCHLMGVDRDGAGILRVVVAIFWWCLWSMSTHLEDGLGTCEIHKVRIMVAKLVRDI